MYFPTRLLYVVVPISRLLGIFTVLYCHVFHLKIYFCFYLSFVKFKCKSPSSFLFFILEINVFEMFEMNKYQHSSINFKPDMKSFGRSHKNLFNFFYFHGFWELWSQFPFFIFLSPFLLYPSRPL